jgi:acyl carrier protein|tara:strand:+ start:607 stop:831 length:225 start_codon:yes stop_codon:yes gene_type:complete
MEVNEILKDVLDLSDHQIENDSTSLNDIDSWDSMTHIVLITELEENLKLRFTNDEIVAMNTVGKIKSIVKSKQK